MPPGCAGTPEGEKTPLLHSILVASRNPFDSGTRTSSAPTVVPGRFRDKIECLECRAHKLRPGSKDGLLRAGRRRQTPLPTGLTHPNRAQRLTAQATTKLLVSAARMRRKQDVAAGPSAARNFFARRLVMALASRLRMDRRSRGTCHATFPIPARLFPPLLTPRFALAVLPRRTPTRPTPRRLTAGRAAIAAQPVRRAKRTTTPFQEATPQPSPTPGANQEPHTLLMRAQTVNMLRWAQGRIRSRTVKSRRKATTSLRDALESTVSLRPLPE